MVNVLSFCLYGPDNPKYYVGLLENIFLAGKYFPDWKVYVYYAPDVTQDMVDRLKACSSVVLRETGVCGPINMIHRFYAIDEDGVDLMMVRDADSRIHWKDRWAIREFSSHPEFVAHTIRDNIEHTADMMGGLWGVRKSSGLHMHSEYAGYKEDMDKGHRIGHDQNFLSDVIYPKLVQRMLVHYSNARRKIGEYAVEFPFEWTNDVYCGRVELEYMERPQPPMRKSMFPTAYVRIRDTVAPTPVVNEPRFSVREPSTNANIIKFLHRK
jgi:hypothetical protein